MRRKRNPPPPEGDVRAMLAWLEQERQANLRSWRRWLCASLFSQVWSMAWLALWPMHWAAALIFVGVLAFDAWALPRQLRQFYEASQRNADETVAWLGSVPWPLGPERGVATMRVRYIDLFRDDED